MRQDEDSQPSSQVSPIQPEESTSAVLRSTPLCPRREKEVRSHRPYEEQRGECG